MSDFFQADLSLGSVPTLEQRTSQAIQEPVNEAQAYVKQQPVIHLDKICWAHLRRDFQVFIERGGSSQLLGEALLAQVELMFEWWYRVRDGTMPRLTFQEKMQPLQHNVGQLLRLGTACGHPKTAATCRHILKREAALWTFVRVEGVEPTNNLAERQVRPAVLWRKRSFGTQSQAGSRFAERIMIVVATLKQQPHHLPQNSKLTGMVGVVAGDDVDLAQNIMPVLAAVGQGREEINLGVVDNLYQFLAVGVETLDGLVPAGQVGLSRWVGQRSSGKVGQW